MEWKEYNGREYCNIGMEWNVMEQKEKECIGIL